MSKPLLSPQGDFPPVGLGRRLAAMFYDFLLCTALLIVTAGAYKLIQMAIIFGPLRSVTLGQRVFTGVLVGFVFRIAQDLLGPSSQVFGFPPLLAVVIPAGICALAGVWLLRRAG